MPRSEAQGYRRFEMSVLHLGRCAAEFFRRLPIMPSPSIVFSFVLATLYGAAFHLVSGGDSRRLALFLLSAWMGFGLGHLGGDVLGVELLDIGPLHMLSATVGAWTALVVARILTRQPSRRSARGR